MEVRKKAQNNPQGKGRQVENSTNHFLVKFYPKISKRPMDPLKVKCWDPKHLGPSYICELSLHPKFRSPSITPSHKKAGAERRRR